MKISELSKELGATSKDIIALANDLGIECKAATKNLLNSLIFIQPPPNPIETNSSFL